VQFESIKMSLVRTLVESYVCGVYVTASKFREVRIAIFLDTHVGYSEFGKFDCDMGIDQRGLDTHEVFRDSLLNGENQTGSGNTQSGSVWHSCSFGTLTQATTR